MCGDFGLDVESGSNTERVCYVGRNYQGILSYGDVVTVTFWFYAGAEFEVVGYFWATEDGELPSATGDTLPLGTEALLEISEFTVRQIPIGGNGRSSGYISPVFTYEVSANETCKSEKDKRSSCTSSLFSLQLLLA